MDFADARHVGEVESLGIRCASLEGVSKRKCWPHWYGTFEVLDAGRIMVHVDC